MVTKADVLVYNYIYRYFVCLFERRPVYVLFSVYLT